MRRERSTVVGDLLRAIESQDEEAAPRRATRLASDANLAYDRMRKYLVELHDLGLVNETATPHLTEKGRELVRRYRAWQKAQEEFGIATEADPTMTMW